MKTTRQERVPRGRWIGRRVGDVYAKAAVVLLNVVICFVSLELAGAGVLAGGAVLTDEETLDSRSHSSYYTAQSWAPQYWREFRDSRRQRYQPYVLWSRRAFSGEFINVDSDGVRLTPGATCNADSLLVFVMGGSTVWGTGAPDWGTLPAYIQTDVQRASDRPVCVVNYGESAYVSTQSVLRLLLLLRAGHVPDLVILCEGPNDVYSAYQSGRSGFHENLEQFVDAFERRDSKLDVITGLMRQTNLFAVVETVVSRITRVEEQPSRLATYRSLGVDEKELAASIAETYLANYEVVEALATKYDFEFRSFWPPYIATGGKPLVAEEQALADAVDPDFTRLYRAVYRTVTAQAVHRPKLVDLNATFDDYPELLWVDDMHVTPVGNQLLAHRIVEELRRH